VPAAAASMRAPASSQAILTAFLARRSSNGEKAASEVLSNQEIPESSSCDRRNSAVLQPRQTRANHNIVAMTDDNGPTVNAHSHPPR